MKREYLKSKHSPFINKMISKDMDWTRLRNRFLRTRSNGDKEAYNKQRKNSISYIWKTKQDYNKSLDQIKVARNKSPGKYIKSFFAIKTLTLIR